MSIDQLLALDDSSAKNEAARALAADIMMSAAFAPLRRGEPPTVSWVSRSRWAEDVGVAALRGWIQASGLGWVRTLEAEPGIPFEALFHPGSPTHRRVATALYLRALPRHCHAGGCCLVDFIARDPRRWGEELAAVAVSGEFLGKLAALDGNRQLAAAGSILGKLHWLAPARVAVVAEVFMARLPEYARAPMPAPESRDATGFVLPYCFDSVLVRRFLEPMMAESIHLAMKYGDIDILEYSWSACTSAALSVSQTGSMTLASFTEGFNRLSPPERALLGGALLKAMPLLSKAIGSFVEVPLRSLCEDAYPASDRV